MILASFLNFLSGLMMDSPSVAAPPVLLMVLLVAIISCSQRTTSTVLDPETRAGSPGTETLVADPNEAPEAIARYHEAGRLMAEGRNDRARTVLEKAISDFPESRHLHQQYAELLWIQSGDKDSRLLREAAQEALRAAEIGLRFGKVDYTLTARLAATLGSTDNKEALDLIFKRLLAQDPSATVYLDYATGLSLAGDDQEAENVLRQAVRSSPNADAAARYGEWLLDRRREREALEILPKQTPVYYIHFLRGVALERLGRLDEARSEYARYREYSRTFPAPPRFRIEGSTAQSGIRFTAENNT